MFVVDCNGFDEKDRNDEVNVNKNDKNEVEYGYSNWENTMHTKGPFTKG